MSWLISRAMMEAYANSPCSPGLAEEYLVENSLDGEQSAPLSVMPTPHKFWRNDKTMESCQLSRFGLTCAILTEDRGAALLMSYRAAFLAKIFPSPETGPALMGNAQGCGESSPASLAKYDHVTHSLKTAQLSLIEDSTGCCVTLPRSGSMRNGNVFQRATLAHRMSVIESGLSEHFPTPTVHGNYNRKGASKTSGDGLATYVRKFPTPTATAYKGWSKNHNRAKTDDRLDYTVEREAHEAGVPGRLNPTWEEWLMGWPIGWTELKPLEMDRFHEWQQQHSLHYQVAHTARMKAIDEELILTAEAVLGESDGH